VSSIELIGVVDLKGGRAVRACGGMRETYAPLGMTAGIAINGDPLALARAYVNAFGLDTLYAADLDAIGGGEIDDEPLAGLAGIAPLWVDAGIASPESARRVIALGAAKAIVGLETLSSFEALSAICAAIGTDRTAFSLDLRAGVPITKPRHRPAEEIAARAVDAGTGVMIVIDLARVGSATGPDFELLARVRAAVPDTPLFAGGGVRGPADLARLAEVGCTGALVASALHDGVLSVTR
jgi:phosphoribosylformimino-5-aminoimidazole carboxamide ribotide isomerase